MLAHTKKHHTDLKPSNQFLYVLDHERLYAIPRSIARKYIVETKKTVAYKGNVAADELFKEMDRKHGEVGALLRGLRARENLSQVEFAKKINVTQANLSKMENGQRPIGKTLAKRISEVFSVNYQYFL